MIREGHAGRLERLGMALRLGLTTLPDKPEESAESTLAALWFSAAGMPLSAGAAFGRELPTLTREAEAELERLVASRLSGIPLAHLTGRQRFDGQEFRVGPGALIPRAETELLVRAAAERIGQLDGDSVEMIDLCTGCGNVALALALRDTRLQVRAGDLSGQAVGLAEENARCLDLLARVRFFTGDLFAAFVADRHRARVITCNPPYVPTNAVGLMAGEIREHEPSQAFDGGPMGISLIDRMVRESMEWLVPGGWLFFEVGAGQGPPMLRRLRRLQGYEMAAGTCDEGGVMRVLSARRAASDMDTVAGR